MLNELVFGNGQWSSVMFGIELTIFVGVLVLFAMYPIMLFAQQVKRVLR